MQAQGGPHMNQAYGGPHLNQVYGGPHVNQAYVHTQKPANPGLIT